MYPDLVAYWNAWAYLSDARDSGFGVGSILPSEVLAYVELVRWPHATRDDLAEVLKKMDREYLKLSHEKMARERASRTDGHRRS